MRTQRQPSTSLAQAHAQQLPPKARVLQHAARLMRERGRPAPTTHARGAEPGGSDIRAHAPLACRARPPGCRALGLLRAWAAPALLSQDRYPARLTSCYGQATRAAASSSKGTLVPCQNRACEEPMQISRRHNDQAHAHQARMRSAVTNAAHCYRVQQLCYERMRHAPVQAAGCRAASRRQRPAKPSRLPCRPRLQALAAAPPAARASAPGHRQRAGRGSRRG